MKYVFNEERNRLEDRSWNPFFIKAVYRDTQTGEERALMLQHLQHLETLLAELPGQPPNPLYYSWWKDSLSAVIAL